MKPPLPPISRTLIDRFLFLTLLVWNTTVSLAGTLPVADSPAAKSPIDVSSWRKATYNEDFFRGRVACGEDALNYWMQSLSYRSDPTGTKNKTTQFELLAGGDPAQVALLNKEIHAECRRVLANVTEWRKKNQASRTPSMWITLALRAPDRITPEPLGIIREALRALDLGDKASGYIGWMGTPGSNGSNVHGYLTPLALAPALINDPKVLAAGEQALRAELAHQNRTGDMGEFNLLESHWNGTASWEIIKHYTPDPRLRRMARMISERLWINRFLTWSPAVERITGPGRCPDDAD